MSLGPFQVQVGTSVSANRIVLRAYIFTHSVSEYVVLLRQLEVANDEHTISEVILYEVVAADKDNHGEGQCIFSLMRLSPLECMLQNSLVTSKQRNHVMLRHAKNIDGTMLKTILMTSVSLPGLRINSNDQFSILDDQISRSIIFGSKIEADIFNRCVEHHSSKANSIASSVPNTMDNDKDSKPKTKRGRMRSGSIVVSLRRTSSGSEHEQLAYEVISMQVPPKKRKGSKTVTPTTQTEPLSNFYFIAPQDFDLLTDYYILLYSQVKRAVMTNADMSGNRKNSASSEIGPGFLGFRCKWCGGSQKGSYFPSSAKNLQACPPTLHTHLLKCQCCPDIIKRSLKLSKTKHKTDITKVKPGAQTMFYNALWTRIQDKSYDGEAHASTIRERLDQIEKVCTPSPNIDANYLMDSIRDDLLPNIVSCEELENDPLISEGLFNAPSSPTAKDWDIAFELLRRPPTPNENNPINLENPPDTIVSPNPVQNNLSMPIAARISDLGEIYHNGEFIIPDRYNVFMQIPIPRETKPATKNNSSQRNKSPKINPNDVSKTRKFTRADEVALVKNILKHGKRWRLIWDSCPELRHIYPAALKDRARSKRFQEILSRAEKDPSLVDNPGDLCGGEDQPEYMDDGTNKTTTSAQEAADSDISELSGDKVDVKDSQNSTPSPQPPQPSIAQHHMFNIGLPIEALVDTSPFKK